MSLSSPNLPTIGFIMLRHVNSEQTNCYWQHSYDCIRKFYPENTILIVDDNSDYSHITYKRLHKTIIIHSEFDAGRGEVLPYYYYLQTGYFDIAVVIHDSVFINQYFDFNVDQYRFLWEFEHWYDEPDYERKMIAVFEDAEIVDFHNDQSLWKGCFGGMTVIKHSFLKTVDAKYNLSRLINIIECRKDRCTFERVFACLLQKMAPNNTILGNIHHYCQWDIKFWDKDKYSHLPIIKVWTGR